jgi:hypothetical protein
MAEACSAAARADDAVKRLASAASCVWLLTESMGSPDGAILKAALQEVIEQQSVMLCE